ncbi:hypothetical protein CGC20_11390 [Leishmania donovani]|uniref:Transcription factor Iwr1 domain-containing protein n=2 Tax=Leishmania donovani TaxID=5661 RepID=A0A504Y3T0_LEIDO|nr:hypothetical protein CGC20_11390 [Leishmania donovani]
MSTPTRTGGDACQPRVYLKVSRKRCRDGFVEEAAPPTLVRVQWDSAEMGPLPPVLHATLSCRTKFIFRRLRHLGAEQSTGMAKALMPQVSTNRQTRPFRSPVERVTASGQCVVIECGDGVSRVDDGAAVVELFTLDSEATEEDTMVEAFGEFAITEDDLVGCTRSSLKRGRVEEDEDLPCYFLAPRRCTCSVGGHSSADANLVSASPSRWGAVETDADGAMWRLLQEYDELLCVEAIGDATEDLYCYPDHRKDDEFDSNAEDFSGNDYPDDADGRSGESAERAEDEASGSSTGRRRGRLASRSTYGMLCEEGYSERSLSSGWNSDD